MERSCLNFIYYKVGTWTKYCDHGIMFDTLYGQYFIKCINLFQLILKIYFIYDKIEKKSFNLF